MEALAPDVYGVFGHGCDILTGEAGENIPVPPGIIYVTIAICGLISIDLIKLMYAFEDTSIWPALRDPVHNTDILRQYFEDRTLMETNLQIHKYGDTYVDSLNTLFYNGSHHVYKSGLYRLGEFQPVRSDVDYGAVNEAGGERIAVAQPYMEAEMRAIYNGSRIQPQAYGPFRNADEFKAANNIGIRMSELFHRMRASDPTRPFVFYNFACRTVCGGYNAATQGRSLARRARNLPANMLRDRMYVPDVDAQVASADSVLKAGAAHVNLVTWIARKRAVEVDRRMHFSMRAAQSASRSRTRRIAYLSQRRRARNAHRSKSRGPKSLKIVSRSTRSR
jgi:hypothetical protein